LIYRGAQLQVEAASAVKEGGNGRWLRWGRCRGG